MIPSLIRTIDFADSPNFQLRHRILGACQHILLDRDWVALGWRAEASSNRYIQPPERWLDQDDYQRMLSLGWHRATDPPPGKQNGKPDPDGSPNFFVDFDYPVDSGEIAELAVRTLREVFRISHPSRLEYRAFGRYGGQIRFPGLRIKREGT